MSAARPRATLVVQLLTLASSLALDAVHANPKETAASPWLEKVYSRPRLSGCWEKPWVCSDNGAAAAAATSRPPFAGIRMCCRNRCVDVSDDDGNCGFCGARCPFSWRCCGGRCVDTRTSPFHCGGCNRRCSFGSLCSYGMCGYAQRSPGFPFPPLPCGHRRPEPPPLLERLPYPP